MGRIGEWDVSYSHPSHLSHFPTHDQRRALQENTTPLALNKWVVSMDTLVVNNVPVLEAANSGQVLQPNPPDLSKLEDFLTSRIRGQDRALGKLTRAVQAAELGLNGDHARVRGSFLFLGPTGVGKTESAKLFTQYVFGTSAALEVMFMNEYSSVGRCSEFFSRLQQMLERPSSGRTLLFDEIEKAHPSLIDVFLSLLDEGQFTASDGRRLAARNAYIVLTSNLGSGDLSKMEAAPYSTIERIALDFASQSLRPELFARISERIVFQPLGIEAQKRIIDDIAAEKLAVLERYFGRSLELEGGPVRAFLIRVCFSRSQGARYVRQEINRQFNAAALPFALAGKTPREGIFRYEAATGAMVLV
jgi:ATP-dependent Clp protease ATP-binding subunit ClpA